MWLLIDDIREMDVDRIARTPHEARYELMTEEWNTVCLDHDLGEKETGYDILNWAIVHGLLPERVILVTANPVGRMNMAMALSSEGYISNDGLRWKK